MPASTADRSPPAPGEGAADPATTFLRAQRGDREAFGVWARATMPLVHRLAFRMVGIAEVDDVVQDTFIKAWRSIGAVRDPNQSVAWVCRIARNTAHDALRRRGKTVSAAGPDGRWLESFVSEDPLPDDVLHSKQAQVFVQDALAAIKEKYRLVFSLREIDGLSEREVGEALGLPLGTVGSRLTRARVAFAKELRRRVTAQEALTQQGKSK